MNDKEWERFLNKCEKKAFSEVTPEMIAAPKKSYRTTAYRKGAQLGSRVTFQQRKKAA